MRRFAWSVALAAPLLSTAVPAQAAAPPIECIYNVLHKTDWPILVKVVRQGIQGETSAERIQIDSIHAATDRCRRQYGWGKKRENIALHWFAGGVLSAHATFELKKYGLDHEHLRALVARLDAPTRQAYLSGQVSNEQSAATFAALAATGISIDAVPAEERSVFARELSQGVLGEALKMQAEADFAAS